MYVKAQNMKVEDMGEWRGRPLKAALVPLILDSKGIE